MSDFNISSTQTVESSPEARAQLDASLASFANKPVIAGTVNTTTPVLPGQASGEHYTEVEEGATVESDTEATEETDTTESEAPSSFDSEFKTKFGVEPTEAVEIINSLSAFRDEMSLMRQWSVSPSEYDGRMSQVQEFYKTLPEDKQSEFNTVEGAKAIWEHLSKNAGTQKKTSTVSKVGGSKKPPSTTPPKALLKKSDILKMDKATYASQLPEINKAWRENRVLEDA